MSNNMGLINYGTPNIISSKYLHDVPDSWSITNFNLFCLQNNPMRQCYYDPYFTDQ